MPVDIMPVGSLSSATAPRVPLTGTLQRARTLLATVLLALLSGIAVRQVQAQAGPLEDLGNFPRATLDIGSSKHRKMHYDIWIADTPAREQQGLMFVRDLPQGQAMLFPLDPPRAMSMWMKNTYIELDIVFVGPDGHIAKIIEHAVPHSLKTLDSGGPVAAVLEIGGGESHKLGFKVGDEVHWTH
jgi:uncharacterized protein